MDIYVDILTLVASIVVVFVTVVVVLMAEMTDIRKERNNDLHKPMIIYQNYRRFLVLEI